MEMIETAIEHLPRFATILVAFHSEPYRHELIETLENRELSVLGPVYTSEQALTLAAQAGIHLAIVEEAQDDSSQALVRQLQETWGIPSVLLQAPA
jgi:hypothetical protein